MPSIQVDKDRCKGCEICVDSCSLGILVMSKQINAKGYFFAEPVGAERCTACMLCGVMCPDLAITVTGKRGAESPKKQPATTAGK
ncbi:MAG: 4Fe-4S binding protein [Polyangiaceae bacterium]|nr:4Fe-4S binding protein [Polyangiaceae bacterium]